jgi:hypothetical protein
MMKKNDKGRQVPQSASSQRSDSTGTTRMVDPIVLAAQRRMTETFLNSMDNNVSVCIKNPNHSPNSYKQKEPPTKDIFQPFIQSTVNTTFSVTKTTCFDLVNNLQRATNS